MKNLIKSIGALVIAGAIALSPCYSQEARFKPMHNYSKVNLENIVKAGSIEKSKYYYELYDKNDMGKLNKHEFNCGDEKFIKLVNYIHEEVFDMPIPDDTIISITDPDLFEERYYKNLAGGMLETCKYGQVRYFIDIKAGEDRYETLKTVAHEFGHRYCKSEDIIIGEASAMVMDFLWYGHLQNSNKQAKEFYKTRKLMGSSDENFKKSYNLVKTLMKKYNSIPDIYNYLRKKEKFTPELIPELDDQ